MVNSAYKEEIKEWKFDTLEVAKAVSRIKPLNISLCI